MTPARPAAHELTIRVGAFAALAGLAGWQWARLITDPPAGRVVLAVVALAACAALLALLSTARLPRASKLALAALGALAATVAGLVAIGIPIRLLGPEAWDNLGHEIGRGFAGLDNNVEYPYGGKNEWSRIVLLAGLPLALGLAAVLAFWPFGRTARGSRTLGLATLIATYAVGATVVAPGQPLLLGVALLAGIAAWLWLPRLGRRDAIAAGALVAVAAGIALAVATRLDASEPWLKYKEWDWTANEAGATFDWDHNYGPLDWPRSGDTLFAVKSDAPHYWKASVLEDFDGVRWERAAYDAGQRLEAPRQVAGESSVVEPEELNPDWVEVTGVTFGPMRSDLVIGPGTPVEVSGLEGVLARPDGTMVTDGGPIEDGDGYSVVSYVPNPTSEEMRTAPPTYPSVLSRFTEIGLPVAAGDAGAGTPFDAVNVPLRGTSLGGHAARRQILASPYAEMYRLAHRLTADELTTYDAVQSIETHLRIGPYAYSEAVPPAGSFPLAEFLSDDRIGYCQQFSGTMALMLRMVGIPSRVATGFSAGARDPEADDRFLVTDFDAHSWVEVYFNGIGWVSFDPTPSDAPANSQIGEGDFASAAGGDPIVRDQGGVARRRAFDPSTSTPSSGGGGPWAILPAGVGILGLAIAVPAAARARRFRSLSPAAAADAQLRELGSGLERLGTPIGPGETLLALEHKLRMRYKPATAGYVGMLRAGRFERDDASVPTLAERRAVRRELSAKRGLRGRLRGLFAIPPGGPRR
jgi:transglutaminase-like putative cysteine protease